jgi:hypothetical protein
MAAHTFSDPCVAADLWFVAPLFDPGVADGGVAATAGASPVDADRVATFLAEAEKQIDRAVWGERASLAVSLLTAHMLAEDVAANATLPGSASSGGSVTSESVGPLSRSFGAFSSAGAAAYDDELFAGTPWGRRFVQLRGQLRLPFAV